ncbi:MAG: hypothetical protein K2J77_06275 [Oscillospiraceae bacterium]|nr:hypothetical protein [Oscillospiraceae bacterium]
MKNNKKIIAAAVLAAVCLSGCNDNSEPQNPGYNIIDAPVKSSITDTIETYEPETSSAETSKPETSSAETSKSETSSTSSTQSESKYPDIVVTVDWNDSDNNSKSDDKSIGYKSPATKEEKLVDALIDELKLNDNKKSDMEKLCILGKWFSDNTEYDHELEATGNYGLETKVSYLLTKHSGVCATYAETAYVILSKCGIDTLICDNKNINHAWNAVKINGKWTYTDFTGGPDTLILGSSRHGLPKYTVINWGTSYGYAGAKPDISEISSDLRLFDFNGKELEVHKEADGFSYVDSSGKTWKTKF